MGEPQAWANQMEELVANLQSDDVDSRSKATEEVKALLFKYQLMLRLLTRMLNSQEPQHLRAAVYTLGRTHDPRAIDALLPFLDHPDKDISQTACIAVIEMLSSGTGLAAPNTQLCKKVFMKLSGLLTNSQNFPFRMHAALGLGALGNPEAVPMLADSLFDNNQDVQEASARALGHLGDPGAVRPLISALSSSNKGLRVRAAEALGQLGGTESVEALAALVNDPEWEVRDAAAFALCAWKDRRASEALIAVLRQSPELAHRSQSAFHLGFLGGSLAVPELLVAIHQQEPAAELVMATKPETYTLEQWMDSMRREHQSTRRFAAQSLGMIGDPRALPDLERLAESEADTDLRQMAQTAIERIRQRLSGTGTDDTNNR